MLSTEWGGGTPRENAIDDTVQAWTLQFVPQVGYPEPSSLCMKFNYGAPVSCTISVECLKIEVNTNNAHLWQHQSHLFSTFAPLYFCMISELCLIEL